MFRALRATLLCAWVGSVMAAWTEEATAPGVLQNGVRAARMDLSGQGPVGYWARSAVSGVSSPLSLNKG
ncbi:MAG: hypothetical protein EOP36_09010 [Rubrivivax sp.]|nr:MAG: hypothetical protein EOP36_09010 [Rubrivivax sp.]